MKNQGRRPECSVQLKVKKVVENQTKNGAHCFIRWSTETRAREGPGTSKIRFYHERCLLVQVAG